MLSGAQNFYLRVRCNVALTNMYLDRMSIASFGSGEVIFMLDFYLTSWD